MARSAKTPGSTLAGLGRMLWLRLPVAVLLLGLLAAPGVQAESYEGPGQSGIVPLGTDFLLAATFPLVGEGITHIPLDGVSERVCKIVLDERTAYARTSVVWSPGNETAYITAEPGERDAPFKVASHWELDLNDECTVEVTPSGKIWHDPRGRPFIDLRFPERLINYNDVKPGEWITIDVHLHNNGTLEDVVNVTLTHMRDEWEIRNPTGVVDRRVGPLETIRFGFDLRLPDSERSGTKLLLFNAEAAKSDWADRATVFLRVAGSDEALSTAPTESEEGAINPHRARDLPSGDDAQSGQIPGPGIGLLLVGFAWLAGRIRRNAQ